ncbi:hypothetical protein QYE76_067961 [Lolium multiflorum]|uniref:Uncharacterized protein n=1 Tax=Lolium multiflorum TaxID=4521 RepID=A0AAD8SEW6_LOLMU|nr:hypothetical protein QYE76_067961 [Lolium multiflorum]
MQLVGAGGKRPYRSRPVPIPTEEKSPAPTPRKIPIGDRSEAALLGGDLELPDPAEDADGSPSPSSAADRWRAEASWAFQHYLDRAAPHTAGRLAGTVLAAASALRVYYAQGFYVVSYGLGIYLLNLLIGFLSPMVDPELEALDAAGPPLPTRLLPEFKFWYGAPSLIITLFPSPPLSFVYREFIRD